MTQEANAPAPNAKLGRYEILGEIGKGGMGVVYRALDPSIGRTVAVKTILMSDQGGPDEVQQLRARLLRESQAAGQLSHPNIVAIYDFGEQQDVAYIVMEYISGPTLEQALAEDPAIRSSTVLLGILADCARALDYAHGKGIVHRDIKPGNIMLQPDGTVKIADFGIAKVLQGSTLTMTAMLVGSPHYMAPEQLKGEAVSGRTDQYALAALAYAMLTGRRPFESESMATLITKTLYEEPPLVPALNPALGPQVDGVLRKGLAKDQAARYSSCTEFVQALRTACNVPAGAAWDDTTGVPTRLAVPERAAIKNEPHAKPKWIPLLIGAVALVVLAVAGFYLYQAHEAARVDLAYWESVKDSKNADLFASYIQRYPNGQFVGLAKAEMANLKAAPAAAVPLTPPVASSQPAPATPHAVPAPTPPVSPAQKTPVQKPPVPQVEKACKPGLDVIASDRFQACADAMSGRGFSPETVTAFENGGVRSLMVAFQPRAARKVTLFVPPALRQEQFNTMMKQGLRPDSVSVLQTPSGPLFTEVWAPRVSPFEARPALLMEGFERERQRHQGDGYVVTDLVPHRARNQIRYSVIWVKDPRLDTVALPGLTAEDLGERTRNLNQQGYRISRISGYDGDSGRRYAAVWEKTPGVSIWRIKMTRDDLLKLHSEMLGKRFHMHHISSVGGEFSAVWWN